MQDAATGTPPGPTRFSIERDTHQQHLHGKVHPYTLSMGRGPRKYIHMLPRWKKAQRCPHQNLFREARATVCAAPAGIKEVSCINRMADQDRNSGRETRDDRMI